MHDHVFSYQRTQVDEGRPASAYVFQGTDRFRLISPVGAGGMGVVFEAYDREHDCHVALKLLPSLDPRAVNRFKNEFRSLQGIRHRNLVSLRELIEHEGHLFFTMELVRGADIVAFVRRLPAGEREVLGAAGPDEPTLQGDDRSASAGRSSTLPCPGNPDWNRVRSTFAQLASALVSLHAHHKVHRDIKPSNVLVARGGRVVLLDFGLVVDFAHQLSKEDFAMGTVSYMSPEQALGSEVGPASDWYGFGAMLYEAITGRPPFVGPVDSVLLRKQLEDPVPASQLAEVPDDIDRLCSSLLCRDPRARPEPTEILSALPPGASRESHRAMKQVVASSLVGRDRELSRLHDALSRTSNGPCVVTIEGESGVGKTAMVREFLSQLAGSDRSGRPDAARRLVLWGRCSERELVPFKAFDTITDQIAEHFKHARSEGAPNPISRLALAIADAALAFPILSQFVPEAEHPDTHAHDEPLARREIAFRGVRDLLGSLATDLRLVLCIDDWQWADADSIALLSAILEPPRPPSILLLLIRRSEYPPPILCVRPERIELGNLEVDDAKELARRLLSGVHLTVESAEMAVSDIAAESTGHPLFIAELARQVWAHGPTELAAPRLDDVLWTRFCALRPALRRALELLAVARAPLALSVLADAMAHARTPLTRADLPEVVASLRDENLARSDGLRATDLVDCFHDRVATAIGSRLSSEDRRRCHESLALAFERSRLRDCESLVVHWRAAGDFEKAAQYALSAADRAMETLGFERAAQLYRACLDVQKADANQVEVRKKLGDALSHLGRGREAAEAYLSAASPDSADRQLELYRLAADQLFRSGYVDEAVELIEKVFVELRLELPRSPHRALWSLALRRAQIALRGTGFRRREAATLPPRTLARVDASWSVAIGLSTVDTTKGAYMQSRHFLMALEAGEPFRILRALAAEAAFQATAGVVAAGKVDRLLAKADALASDLDDPYAFGFTHLARGISMFLRGDWKRSRDSCQAAESIFEGRPVMASWELASARLFLMWALISLGDHSYIRNRVPELIREAQGRGNLYAATNFRLGLCNLAWLVRGEPAEARRQLLDADSSLQSGVKFQHFWSLEGWVNLELYEDNAGAAYARAVEMAPRFQRALLLRLELARATFVWARGRAAVALACTNSRHRNVALGDAERCARSLCREKLPWANAAGRLLSAGVANVRGDARLAIRELREAAHRADECDYRSLAAVARGRLEDLGAEEGERASRDVDVAEPERWAAVFAPGFVATNPHESAIP